MSLTKPVERAPNPANFQNTVGILSKNNCHQAENLKINKGNIEQSPFN